MRCRRVCAGCGAVCGDDVVGAGGGSDATGFAAERSGGLPGVVVVEYAPLDTFHSNVARGIIGVPTLWTNRSLYGEGEIIAVADSGIDVATNMGAVIHADFQDGAGGSRLLWVQDFSSDGAQDPGQGASPFP